MPMSVEVKNQEYDMTVEIDEDRAEEESSTTQDVGNRTGDQQMHEVEIPTVENLTSEQSTTAIDNQNAVDPPKDEAGDPSAQENMASARNTTCGQGDQSKVNFPTIQQIFGYCDITVVWGVQN